MTRTVPTTMRAIEISAPGAPDVLRPTQRPVPQPAAGEVLIQVAYAGVNRPDVLQRKGGYPPPPGASDIPGLEIAGTIVSLGANVAEWAIGSQVCALVTGGGYAQYVSAPAVQCLPIPKGLSPVEAAGLPEAAVQVVETAMSVVIKIHGALASGPIMTFASETCSAPSQMPESSGDAQASPTASSRSSAGAGVARAGAQDRRGRGARRPRRGAARASAGRARARRGRIPRAGARRRAARA